MSSNLPKWLVVTIIAVVAVIVVVVGYLALRPAPIHLKTAEEMSKMPARKPMPAPPVIPGM